MTYSTIVDRDALSSFDLPDSIVGNTFHVTVTPVSEIEERRQAFARLKGVLGSIGDFNTIREERINASVVGH